MTYGFLKFDTNQKLPSIAERSYPLFHMETSGRFNKKERPNEECYSISTAIGILSMAVAIGLGRSSTIRLFSVIAKTR